MKLSAAPLKPLTAQAAKARAADPEDKAREKAKLREACRMFEAQFLKMLWKEMRRTVPKAKLIHGGYGEEVFTDLLDQAVSDQSVKGGSMGLADLLERQLSREGLARPGVKMGEYLRPAPGGPAGMELRPPVEGILTSGFGPRVHPITGRDHQHTGLDLAAPRGTPVRAAAAGRVEFAGTRGGYGKLVVIVHADGSSTYYGHLDQIAVRRGELVAAGQQVATVGSTGSSTGPHLHFEARDAGGRPLNPLPRLAVKGFNSTT